MSYQGKDSIIQSLLSNPTAPPPPPRDSNAKRTLISEVGQTVEPAVSSSSDGLYSAMKPDGPTMMDLMMEAQAAAKKEVKELKAEEERKQTKTFGSGFKKGFFGSGGGGGSTSESAKKANKVPQNNLKSESPSAQITNKVDENTSIPSVTAKKSASSGLVMSEVQKALSEDEDRKSSMLSTLKSGEWVTPDLEQSIASSAIMKKALQNPKCVAALQLMQKDPKEAERRFKGDPDIDEFMREFGRIMGSHFTGLGEQQGTDASKVVSPPVQEIGPLHAQALSKSKESVPAPSVPKMDTDEQRVKEIVNDPELSAMLLDPELQRILVECGDPVKFQGHMRDPTTARKIKKLFDAGLVGTAK